MSTDGRRRRTLSYEERVLWTTVTLAIKPLQVASSPAPDVADAAPSVERKPAKPLPPAARVKAPRPPVSPPPQVTPKPAPPPLAQLGRRERSRVARGKQAIDARLDLHGLTQDEAHGTLLRFLRTASARDARLVLVITGKGDRDGGRGVLRRQVPQWLGLPEFRSLVVGFEDAHIGHGGEGALYVRVRRER